MWPLKTSREAPSHSAAFPVCCSGSPVPSLSPAFRPCRKQCRSSFPLDRADRRPQAAPAGSLQCATVDGREDVWTAVVCCPPLKTVTTSIWTFKHEEGLCVLFSDLTEVCSTNQQRVVLMYESNVHRKCKLVDLICFLSLTCELSPSRAFSYFQYFYFIWEINRSQKLSASTKWSEV